jgi:hypothetical protein
MIAGEVYMKIDKAIVSSDSNPMYLDFWAIVSKMWSVKFGITPVLLYFGDNVENISTEYGEVIQIPILDGIPVSTQAQCARIWYAGQCGEEVVITSDIDMLPLSPKYYVDPLIDIDDDKYVHLNPLNGNTYFPMCYNVGKSSTLKEILDIDTSFEDFMNKLIVFSKGKERSLNVDGLSALWFLDEIYTTAKVNEYRNVNPDRIIPIIRSGGQNGYRIDRPTWGYDLNLVKENYYYDSHSVRPYVEYKDTIDMLVNTSLTAGVNNE